MASMWFSHRHLEGQGPGERRGLWQAGNGEAFSRPMPSKPPDVEPPRPGSSDLHP